MTTVELIARALSASRTGRTDEWSTCCADALLVLAACGIYDALLPSSGAENRPIVANDP